MNIIDALRAAEIDTPHKVSARKLLDSEHAQAIMITLEPGEKLRRHITPVDVFFFVLEGTGIVEIGDEQETVSANMLIESPAGIVHRLLNEGQETFRFLVVKTPRPTTKTQLL